MHPSSYCMMQRFVIDHLQDLKPQAIRILDVGSQDVNGTYRALFDSPRWEYVGADMAPGPNVDVVLAEPYRWDVPSASFDVVISGQTLEHVEHPLLTMLEIQRVLVPNGLSCLIAPSSGPEHRYPVDCWRILPDGMATLARIAGLHIEEIKLFVDERDSSGAPNVWRDCTLVARRPAHSRTRFTWLRHLMLRRLLTSHELS